MSGIFTVTVSEARGNVAVPADIDNTAIVMGCSSAGSGLSSFYLSGQSAQTALGYGDAVDTLCQIVEQKQESGGQGKKVPAALYTLPVDAVGAYGAPDLTGITGTVVIGVDAAVQPYGTYDGYAICVTGGIVGTAGITFRTSLDGGVTLSRITALGTASSFTVADGNVKFTLSPSSSNLTTLNTLIDELKTKINAHEVLTTGAVHGASDSADNVGALAAATTTATRVALVNACRASYEAHRVKTAGGVHGAADATNVTVWPVATDDSSALMLALDLKAKFNAHRIVTAGSVHGLADSTNSVVTAAPSAGAWIAGDVVRVRTTGPAPATAAVTAAGAVLARSSTQFGILVADFECNAAMLAILSNVRSALLLTGKRVLVLTRAAIRNLETAQSEAAWAAATAADFLGSNDSTIGVVNAYGLVTDATTGRQYLRSKLQQFAADVVRVPRSVWPDCPADQNVANFSLVNSTGSDVGHDEGPRGALTGLSDEAQGNRFICSQRLPDASRLEAVYSTVPWVMFAPGEKIQNIMTRRIANAMERDAVSAGNTGLGGKLRYNPAKGSTPAMLTEPSRRAAQKVIYDILAVNFADDIQNADAADLDTGLVQVNPRVTVTGGNLLSVAVTLAPLVFGYLLNLSITLAVQE